MGVTRVTLEAEVEVEVGEDTEITAEVIRVKDSHLSKPNHHHPTSRRQANLNLAKEYSASNVTNLDTSRMNAP